MTISLHYNRSQKSRTAAYLTNQLMTDTPSFLLLKDGVALKHNRSSITWLSVCLSAAFKGDNKYNSHYQDFTLLFTATSTVLTVWVQTASVSYLAVLVFSQKQNRTVHTNSLFSSSSMIKIRNSLTWDDRQLRDAVLCSEGVRHLALVGTSVRQICAYNNKQLIISSEEVSFCDNKVFAIFPPRQLRFWRSRGHTFQHNWFPSNDLFVFHCLHKWWWFWK